MPQGWVQNELRAGTAVVLIDGVDELPRDRREDVRSWLRDLLSLFPHARYIITSRPGAAPSDWLDAEDFLTTELEPMGLLDIEEFVRRWHLAIRHQADESDDELTDYEARLVRTIQSHGHLRRLAGFPLLCALLCALHLDRYADLPSNRMELYEIALQMLLERRDHDRRIAAEPSLTRTHQTLLLQDLALWFIRNGWTSASVDRVTSRIRARMSGMRHITASPADIYRLLLERSGPIREPVVGRVDFLHRSFQEYLAAKAVVDEDVLDELVRNAHHDQWQEVVVMAAGHAPGSKCADLLRKLLVQAEVERPARRQTLQLLALACLETAPRLAPDLHERISTAAANLMPPRTMTAARAIARAGSFALDLLAAAVPTTANEVCATIRAIADVGDPALLPNLARFGSDSRPAVVRELLGAWTHFEPDEYARLVLRNYPRDERGSISVYERPQLRALRHLKRLRRLAVFPDDDEAPVDVDFLRSLPGLEHLSVSDVLSLVPLAGSSLRSFAQESLEVPDGQPLSLRPVESLSRLEQLAFRGRRVSELNALNSLHLSRLVLGVLESEDRIAQLARHRSLRVLGIGGLPYLTDLTPLEFLAEPEEIEATRCPSLRDIRTLTRWSRWLQRVHLGGAPGLNLESLVSLTRVYRLELDDGYTLDLSPLSGMVNLTEVVLFGAGPVDLTPLSHASSLHSLFVHGHHVDVGALAGRRGLTLWVKRSAVVLNRDALGSGSRVRTI